MALQRISAAELAGTPTLFSDFMGHSGREHRTVGELLTIYRECSRRLAAEHDRDEDLRVERFMSDMAGDCWNTDVVIRIGELRGMVMIIDGIHRGIAYLACVEDGISTECLPALCVER
jgi:hypothetical protein